MLGSCQSPAVGFKDGVEEDQLLGDALSSKTSVGLGTLEGCGDGESDSVLVVEGVELGPQLTEEEVETLGTCDWALAILAPSDRIKGSTTAHCWV